MNWIAKNMHWVLACICGAETSALMHAEFPLNIIIGMAFGLLAVIHEL